MESPVTAGHHVGRTGSSQVGDGYADEMGSLAGHCTRAVTGKAPRMTTQVPPGPEHAVPPHDYPQFVMGHAQYPPPAHEHHPQPDQPVSTYPAVSYPQEGATGYPMPAPYPQPGVQPPPAAYPTAPPWAAQPPAPATGPGVPAEPILPEHGGLLVQYPEAMQLASRAQAPAVWPVAAFTLLFGIFGAVSAKRRASQARRTRNSSAPYWIAFLVSAVAGNFIWFVLGTVVIDPMVTEFREGRRLEALQRNVVSDGRLKNARIDVTAAQCRAVTDRTADGLRDYLCRLTLADGHTASLTLTSDESGQWSSGPGR